MTDVLTLAGHPLLDREREIEVLEGHLAAAKAGQGRVVLLEGPAGIGKTTLISALRNRPSAAGVAWLAARGSEQERDHPFGVVRQLLEPVVGEEDARLLAGAAALARTVLGPEPLPPTRGDAGFAGLHGLYWLVHNLAERAPLVLAVDDLQWADAPSLRFLDYLAVRLEGLAVLAVTATRAGEGSLTLGPIARLADHPDVHALPLSPLSRAAVARWVRRDLAEPATAEGLSDACLEATGGNPFLLAALLGELRRTPGAADPDAVRRLAPASIVRSVGVRLGALPPAAVALAQATAVLGDPAEIAEGGALAGLDAAAAAQAADDLAAAGLLGAGRPLHFVHPVVLAAVRESLRPSERAVLHRHAAELARERGALDVAAGHLLATDPAGDAWAAEVLLRAAQVAATRGAPDAAMTFLRRADAEPPDAATGERVAVELARIAGLAREPDALALAQRAVERVRDPALRLVAARELALQHALDGRHDDAAAVLGRVLAEVEAVPGEQRLLAEGMLLLSAGQSAASRRLHRERLQRAEALATSLGDQAPGPLLVIVGFEHVVVRGDVEEGCAMVERGLGAGRLLRDVSADSPFPYMAAIAMIVAGRYPTADHVLSEALADASRRGSLRGFLVANALRAMVRYRRGDLRGAEADARTALEAQEGLSLLSDVYARAALCGVLVERGELAEAEQTLDGVPEAAANSATHLGHHILDMRARLRLAQDRPADALADLEACLIYEREMEVRHGGWSAWRAKAAEAHLALGDRRRAAAIAGKALELARDLGTPRPVGLALRVVGLTSDDQRAVEALAQAAGVLERGGLAVDHARVLADLGGALAAHGRADEARATLAHALERAETAGAVLVAATARDRLVALGARPRRREVTGSGALTPAERRVAEMAAAGCSNREIAEGLFLTLKTVENHLTATYRKLSISSRTQLADRLA